MHDDVTLAFELARYLRREQFVADDAAAFMAALSMTAALAEHASMTATGDLQTPTVADAPG